VMVKRRLVFGLAAVGVFLVGFAVIEVHAQSPAQGLPCPAWSDCLPCPDRPRQVQATAFHFSPGLAQHQSWIEFSVPEPDATAFSLCLDGRLWEVGIGESPENGRVRINVNTTFVDTEWLLGNLDRFQQPGRWELGYTTYTIQNG
jgi:hypothetical protein